MLLQLISSLLGLQQQAVVYVTSTQLKATNTNTGKTATLSRRENHPRSLIGDFLVVEQEFIEILRQIFPHRWIRSDLLICLIGKDDGGFTSIERRAFREVGLGAGAKRVFLAEKELSPKLASDLCKGRFRGDTTYA